MRELLIRWAKAEPERCAHSPDLGHSGFEVKLGDARIHVWPSRGLTAPSAVQGAVQEAIEARGWFWRLAGPTRGGHSGQVVYGQREHESRIGDGDTAAEALLSAYLDALEAA